MKLIDLVESDVSILDLTNEYLAVFEDWQSAMTALIGGGGNVKEKDAIYKKLLGIEKPLKQKLARILKPALEIEKDSKPMWIISAAQPGPNMSLSKIIDADALPDLSAKVAAKLAARRKKILNIAVTAYVKNADNDDEKIEKAKATLHAALGSNVKIETTVQHRRGYESAYGFSITF